MESHKTLFESLDKAEKHFEAGQIRLAQKLVNEVSRSLKAEGKVSNKLRHRFNFMSAQSRYFNDISSFATNPKRNDIIKEIEALIAQPHENPKKQANEIHGLQTKWQLLDQSSKPAGREQWITFKNLTDKAWEPCAQYYEELKALKIANARQREEIIESIIQYTNSHSSKWPGLIEMSKYLSQTFQKWQSFAPVLDEDFKKLKEAYHLARKPINDAINDQETKNYKAKEALIEKVKLIDDEDTRSCIQKFKKIKSEYQSVGPAGKKNESLLWKKLNESADRFFEAEKSLANDELLLIKQLSSQLQEGQASINTIKEQLKELNKTRKSPEFTKLQKDLKAFELEQLEAVNANKLKTYQNLLSHLETDDENKLLINKDIFRALHSPLYAGNNDELLECVVMLELIAKIDPPSSDKILKQKLSLEMLQNKFSGKSITDEEIKNLIIKFINNLHSKKINSDELKLWERMNEVFKRIINQLP